MKILHTSDWHLGKTLCGRLLIEDQEYFIENVFFKAIDNEKPDLIIIAGDIFDRAIAPNEAIAMFNKVILKIGKEYSIPLVIISGNHDSRERMAIGADLLKDNGIYIINSIRDFDKPISFEKDNQRVNIYAIPYFDYNECTPFFKDEKVSSLKDSFRLMIDEIKKTIDKDAFNILVSHCYINGCVSCESESSLYIAQSQEVSASLFEMFDHVALGHLHTAQKAGPNGRYCGAPLSYSFSEKSFQKSMDIINIDDNKKTITPIKIEPLRKVRVIRGRFNDIVEIGKKFPSSDYICAELEDSNPIYMPIDQLRVYFPNIISISADWMKASLDESNKEKDDNHFIGKKLNEEDIFCRFIKDICQKEVESQDISTFYEILKNVKKEEDK